MTDPRQPAGAPGHPQAQQPRPVGMQQPGMPQAPRPVIPQSSGGQRPGIAAMPMQSVGTTEADLDPIELVEDELLTDDMPMTAPAPAGQHAATGMPPPPMKSKIKAFGQEAARKEHNWKRTPVKSGAGACRVKTFHGKYSDQGIEHLDDMINEWLDAHAEVEVKFVTSTVNTFEGKIREPALVLNLWY